MSELKPCPFCGGETELKRYKCGDWQIICYHRDGCIMREDLENGYFEDADLQAVIRAWNSRAEQTCELIDFIEHVIMDEPDIAELSCGHDCMVFGKENIPNYCSDCGAKVVER